MNADEVRGAIAEAVTGARHLLGQIEASRRRLGKLLPLDGPRLISLSDDEWDALYAFQMKFLLLQDLAAKRLLKGFLSLGGEDPRDLSLRQAVDRVAELGALTSGDDWLDLTIARNALAHDYPVNLDEFIIRFDTAWTRVASLTENVALLIRRLQEEPKS